MSPRRQRRTATPALTLAGVGKIYTTHGAVEAVRSVDLEVVPGELVAVLGPRSSGTSTLLAMIVGLESPTSGRIASRGRRVRSPGTDRPLLFSDAGSCPGSMRARTSRSRCGSADSPRSSARRSRAAASISCRCITTSTRAPPTSRLASSNGWRSLAPSPATRPFCYSTSPSPRSIRARVRRSMTSCKRVWTTIVVATHDPLEAVTLADHRVGHCGPSWPADDPGTRDHRQGFRHLARRTPTAVRRTDATRYRRWLSAPGGLRIPGGERLEGVQRRALAALTTLVRRHRATTIAVVSHDIVGRVLVCQASLFPAHFGAADLSPDGLRHFVGHRLDAALAGLHEQVRRGLLLQCPHDPHHCDTCETRAGIVIDEFARRLPAVRTLLGSDARAAFEGDPAATSADEAVFCYPGITAITHQRLAHELYDLGVPFIPRMITELAHGATGIDIHPGARIGGSFFIDHGTGVVIGETCVIGDRVRLYQGVTLGAKSFPTDEHGRPIKGRPRHPIVENDVTIYAGATILGRITIGRGSSIGGNVWLTRAVPPGSSITQGPARDETFEGGSGI